MEESWWVLDGLSLADSTSTYIASLYWGVTTITTVSAAYPEVSPCECPKDAVSVRVLSFSGHLMLHYAPTFISTFDKSARDEAT